MDAALLVNLTLPRFTWKEGASTEELPWVAIGRRGNSILWAMLSWGGGPEVYKNANWAWTSEWAGQQNPSLIFCNDGLWPGIIKMNPLLPQVAFWQKSLDPRMEKQSRPWLGTCPKWYVGSDLSLLFLHYCVAIFSELKQLPLEEGRRLKGPRKRRNKAQEAEKVSRCKRFLRL